jgi:TolB-like protein/Flp pilus assembly protein TadD
VAIIVIAYLAYNTNIFKFHSPSHLTGDKTFDKKSIAVLPFINDSDDSSNVYIINGLMESILSHLQKIEDLRVVSRTSVEKYRNNPKTISDIGEELNVKYVIEGSGQKIGDEILLSIQLIEASNDMHLWSRQYTRDTKDIFKLQQEIAKLIADEINVIITPEEEARINKIPTDNMEAYDYYLKGRELYYEENYEEALTYYNKAIEEDSTFAIAYASAAISYFFIDFPKSERRYSDKINNYADKALLFDPKSEMSLIAKALYYYNTGEYELAVPHLEKAREYNPNSALVNNTLADLYARFIPNTAKYLEYALKGIQIDIGSQDSVTTSFTYLHLSNALAQTGFIGEAQHYIQKSLAYYPENIYSSYLQAYILYAKNRDLLQLQQLLANTLIKDTTRLDVLHEVGKSFYFTREYDKAYQYYRRFINITEAQQLNIFQYEYAKIGFVLEKVGRMEESRRYFNEFKEFAEQDQSIYKNLLLSSYYSYMNEKQKALEHLELFSQEENIQYWFIVFEDVDPIYDNIRGLPEFIRIHKIIQEKFWENHSMIKSSLKEEGLI